MGSRITTLGAVTALALIVAGFALIFAGLALAIWSPAPEPHYVMSTCYIEGTGEWIRCMRQL